MNKNQPDEIADRTKLKVAALLDRQLSALGIRAMAPLRLREGDHAADIGCGTGQTCLQLANAVGATGSVLGIDLSPAMAAAATARTAGSSQINVTVADARNFAFEPRSYDALYSRFGVMFFSDPVEAYRNLHGALKIDGKIAFVCWRRLQENDLDLVPLQAALPYLPAGLTPNLDEAEHFSFSDPDTVQSILSAADFREVQIARHDAAVSSGDLDSMLELSLSVGALGKIIRENPVLRERVSGPVKTALETHGRKSDHALNAAVWIVSAQR